MKTTEELSKEIVENLSDSITRYGKYKRDGQCLFEKDWVYLEGIIEIALTHERQEAERLRSALEEIMELTPSYQDNSGMHSLYIIAREALGEQREK